MFRCWECGLIKLGRGLRCWYVGSAGLCVKDGSNREVRPAKPKQEGRFIWASCAYEKVKTSQEMHFIFMRPGQAEWTRPRPLSIPRAQAVPKKTCLCCLEDCLPSSQVGILPCGHVYHQDCIAQWSFASAFAVACCPCCRTRYDRCDGSEQTLMRTLGRLYR